MSDIKPGDRVRVTFETTVSQTGMYSGKGRVEDGDATVELIERKPLLSPEETEARMLHLLHLYDTLTLELSYKWGEEEKERFLRDVEERHPYRPRQAAEERKPKGYPFPIGTKVRGFRPYTGKRETGYLLSPSGYERPGTVRVGKTLDDEFGNHLRASDLERVE